MAKEPYFMVQIEGEDVSAWITTIRITEDDRRVDRGTIEFIDQEMIFCDAIQEGALVSIDLGYYEAGKHGIVMKGHITKVDFLFPDKGRPKMEIHVLDESIKMGLEEKRVLWNKEKVTNVSEIISQIVSQHGLTEGKVKMDPDPKITDHYCILQDSVSDLFFLQSLAAEFQCKCFFEYEDQQGKFYFIPEDMILRQVTSPLVYHDAESNLLEFRSMVSSGYIRHYGLAQAIDPETGQPIKNDPKELADLPDWSINQDRFTGAKEKDEKMAQAADKIFQKAQAKRKSFFKTLKKPGQDTGTPSRKKDKIDEENLISKSSQYGEIAKGTAVGDFMIRAKSSIEVKGVAERFCGSWYVPTVTHVISKKGYVTHFDCTR